MSLFLIVLVSAGLVMGMYWFWQEDALQRRDDRCAGSFLVWLGKGLLVPLLVWIFFNAGWLVQPLLPQITLAGGAGGAFKAFLNLTAGFLFVATTWWAAITCAWIFGNILARAERRTDVVVTAAIWLAFVSPAVLIVLLVFDYAGLGLAAGLCTAAVTFGTIRIGPFEGRKEIKPTYSRAVAKMNFDKFTEAELEIIRQLEESENDFEGWMLLAELYAVHFKDLATAEKTICDLCDDPNTNPSQLGIALNRLADWHLKIDGNPQNARWALQRLCERLPGTHLATMAQRRLDHLPVTREQWADQQQHGHVLQLPKVEEQLPLTTDETHGRDQVLQAPEGHVVRIEARRATPTSRETATAEAARCVEQLKSNPDDVMARERFATLLAEALEQPDTAIEQLDLLLAMVNQPEHLRAQWMTRQAEWHLKFRNDAEAARAAYQRVIREVPQSQAAFDAQRRLYLMQIQSSVKLKRRALPGDKVSAATESLPRRA
jgi:hypothetical protein